MQKFHRFLALTWNLWMTFLCIYSNWAGRVLLFKEKWTKLICLWNERWCVPFWSLQDVTFPMRKLVCIDLFLLLWSWRRTLLLPRPKSFLTLPSNHWAISLMFGQKLWKSCCQGRELAWKCSLRERWTQLSRLWTLRKGRGWRTSGNLVLCSGLTSDRMYSWKLFWLELVKVNFIGDV